MRDELGSANTTDRGAPPVTIRSSLWHGVVMNLFGPGPYTFWFLVSGPILVSALRESTGSGVAFLLGFYGALIGGLLAIAAIFHQARRLEPGVVRALSLASILILAAFGIILLKRWHLGISREKCGVCGPKPHTPQSNDILEVRLAVLFGAVPRTDQPIIVLIQYGGKG